MRVVVVDDDPDIRLLLGMTLSTKGIEVVGQADNGRSGLDEVARTGPDGVVLDLRMPVMDGWETLRSLRQDHPQTRVVVYTAERLEAPGFLLELGASAVVRKPATPSSIVRALLSS